MGSYPTLSPLPVRPKPPSAVCSLWHFPSPRDARALPGAVPCGARTFLERRAEASARDLFSLRAPRHNITALAPARAERGSILHSGAPESPPAWADRGAARLAVGDDAGAARAYERLSPRTARGPLDPRNALLQAHLRAADGGPAGR